MREKSDVFLLIGGLLIILLVIVGVSYAYFTANMTGGDETTTIEVKGGKMTITYEGGEDIELSNIIPDDNPAIIKTFTVTGYNNTEVEMWYKISLIVEENTFSEEALKYKLISYNTDNNGITVPSITTLSDIPSGTNTIELGTGSYDVPTDGDKTHTYDLEIYFPNQEYNQNEDQEKEIKAYVKTENYIPPCFYDDCLIDKILEQEGGAPAIEEKGLPNFTKIAVSQATYDALPATSTGADPAKDKAIVENGLYAASDEYGTSYYYRGDKNVLNNNLLFGGFQWKIIRINGDGSIRILYNGTEDEFISSETMNSTGVATTINQIEYAWNETYKNDAKYMGYTYGGANGATSWSRATAVSNTTGSNAKTQLENWYETKISGKSFESLIIDNIFCNDRQLENEVGGTLSGPGYGNSSETVYAAYYRLYTNRIPTLKCGQQNDCFTKDDILLGNGFLKYPVGLLTADEVSMAGFVHGINSNKNYLFNNINYWLITPRYMYPGAVPNGTAYLSNVSGSGNLSYSGVEKEYGLRAVLNLSSETRVSGAGSAISPYVVLGT